MATDVLTKAAAERLKRATDGRDPSGYTAVMSGDVIAVAASLQGDKADGVTAALLLGAKNSFHKDAGSGEGVEIYQRTDHLLHLLEQAG